MEQRKQTRRSRSIIITWRLWFAALLNVYLLSLTLCGSVAQVIQTDRQEHLDLKTRSPPGTLKEHVSEVKNGEDNTPVKIPRELPSGANCVTIKSTGGIGKDADIAHKDYENVDIQSELCVTGDAKDCGKQRCGGKSSARKSGGTSYDEETSFQRYHTSQGLKQNCVSNYQNLWLKAIVATGLLSMFPLFVLPLIPVRSMEEHRELLRILLSFASGGLLGDAFLHLIPRAVASRPGSSNMGADLNHNETLGNETSPPPRSQEHYMNVGLAILSGIIVFLMVEKLMRYLKIRSSCTTLQITPVLSGSFQQSPPQTSSCTGFSHQKKKSGADISKHNQKSTSPSAVNVCVTGYLNLAADFTHNFTDGLAIGASFLAGEDVGVVTAVTILLHEIPHEIGDYAILVRSGCSKKKAILLQFCTAIGAILGTLFSLQMNQTDHFAAAWVLPFTAGGFIYISLVSVMPELLGDSRIWQSIKEIVSLVVGVSVMGIAPAGGLMGIVAEYNSICVL